MTFKDEILAEYLSILDYWMRYTIDEERGGFFGRIDDDNNVDAMAAKGSVLHARILWAFSAAFNFTRDEKYLIIAQRAFDYIMQYFVDDEQGGVYWTVDAKGRPLETRKQVYAQAFTIYGLSEYFHASGNMAAKQSAIRIYHLLQQHSHDSRYGGYVEAFSKAWQPLDDLRLSDKDANEKKTMNTHLHVLEAYTNLYSIWPDKQLHDAIFALLDIFSEKIIDRNTHHLHLFFDEYWNIKSATVSYGHDIEASWLLLEAAEVLADKQLVYKFRSLAVSMASVSAEGLDRDGGLWYEYVPAQNRLIKEKHWWPQAEALAGFLNAWAITGDKMYYDHARNNWNFISQHIIDKKKGEWHWGVKEDYSIMKEDKAGLWKCPYHNSRACLKAIKSMEVKT